MHSYERLLVFFNIKLTYATMNTVVKIIECQQMGQSIHSTYIAVLAMLDMSLGLTVSLQDRADISTIDNV